MQKEIIQSGVLYIIPIPIGNIKDITIRAIEILSQVDILLVEDTRSIQYLLQTYKLKNIKLISYYSYNEESRILEVVDLLNSKKKMALVSEAGTPLISDPGFLLVRKLIEENIPIISIPGACAITTALPVSGFPLSNFYFAGFLSSKDGKRNKQLEYLKTLQTVIIFYESPHRLEKLLMNLVNLFPGNTPICIARELTKQYESIYRTTLENILQLFNTNKLVLKGEFVIIIDNVGGH